jgi:hypothetical protein
MLVLTLLPGTRESARLTVGTAGFEWLEFEAALAPTTDLRLVPDGRPFPSRGTVSIRRGPDHGAEGERIVDALRYIEGCVDDVTGEAVRERFGVTLFIAPATFDRLVERAHWGLPEVVLSFDPSGSVVAPTRSADGLSFHRDRGAWERIAGATLTQRLRSGTH